MGPLGTRIDPGSERYQSNRATHLELLDVVQKAWAKARAGGGDRHVARHRKRGKLLPRERVDLLLDEGAPFLEIGALAGMNDGTVPGAGVVGGIGWVCGRPCLISASEATVQGGSIHPSGLKKFARLAEIGAANELPAIHLIESGGADLPNQADLFVPGGEMFRDITRRSRARTPTLSVVFGSCTAGGAYIPGMSDYTVMVKEAAYMYLAGPPLVKMATGEVVDDEQLGGAELHSRTSGVSDYLAEDETDAIRMAREIVATWPSPRALPRKARPDPPVYDIDELLGVVSADVRQPFDCREVVARIVDGSRFHEFKPAYGSTLVCGWAEIDGFRVGILGNNGVLFRESAEKGAQFIQLCNQSATPLLFLQNTTGFMVGRDAEAGGIIKAGAKLINAVANSSVPAITWMIGGSYGAGNYAMMGRAYKPRFLFTWPNHRIAVMGPEQLAGVLDLVKRAAAARRGVEVNEEELAMMKQMLVGKVEYESTATYASGRLWDDGVVDPRDTRTVLSLALRTIHQAPIEPNVSWGVFRH